MRCQALPISSSAATAASTRATKSSAPGPATTLAHADKAAVSGRRGHDDGGVAERRPEAGHVDPDRPHRVRLHVVAPQRGSQPFSAHGLVGVEEQDGQNGTRLGAAQRDRAAVVHHFERPE